MKKVYYLIPILLLTLLSTSIISVFAATPIVQHVTGGGWILGGCATPGKKTFGFVAIELEDGTLKGNVQYVDHGPFGGYERGYPHVHGYEITSLTITGEMAEIEGICRLNGDRTPREFFVHVHDVGEPGKHDVFRIGIPSIGYDSGDRELGFPGERGGGGNIQIHIPEP